MGVKDPPNPTLRPYWGWARSDVEASGSGAPAWAAGATYGIGDLVTYSGVQYRCTTAHVAGASFDAGSFEAATGAAVDGGPW